MIKLIGIKFLKDKDILAGMKCLTLIVGLSLLSCAPTIKNPGLLKKMFPDKPEYTELIKKIVENGEIFTCYDSTKCIKYDFFLKPNDSLYIDSTTCD